MLATVQEFQDLTFNILSFKLSVGLRDGRLSVSENRKSIQKQVFLVRGKNL
jgi:hypothetical protein